MVSQWRSGSTVASSAVSTASKTISKVNKGVSKVKSISGKVSNKVGKVINQGGQSSSNGGTCFVEGTLVSTVNGNKAIEDIQLGDLVYSYNEETGEVGIKSVTQTFVHETDRLVHIKVDGQIIDTTEEHPFYVSQKGWTAAYELRTGDKLLLQNGKIVIVEMVQYKILKKSVKVYNFEVSDWHNYFVSDSKVLVHNACSLPKDMSPVGAGRRGAFNAAKSELGIPRAQQPLKVLPNINRRGDLVPGKVYDFGNGKMIRDDVIEHSFSDGTTLGPHFNVGKLHFFY